MSKKITQETIRHISDLAQLQLNCEEISQAQNDMQQMLDYAELLEQLNTENIEPMIQPFRYGNFFRDDIVSENIGRKEILSCAPREENGQYLVPIAVESGGNNHVSED